MSDANNPIDVVDPDLIRKYSELCDSLDEEFLDEEPYEEDFEFEGFQEGNEHLLGFNIGDRPTRKMLRSSEAAGDNICVTDQTGHIVTKIPGKDTLKKVGFKNYKDQIIAALRNPIIRKLRHKIDNLTQKGRDRQELLESNHALKLRLGPNWTEFYTSLISRQDNILEFLLKRNRITKEELDNIIKNTGWIFGAYTAVPVYEQLIHQESKHAKSNKGGLYKLILEVAPGNFMPFFAKKHGKRKEYERTLKVQPTLARLTMGQVGHILAKDNYNEITVEPFISGNTLTAEFASLEAIHRYPALKDGRQIREAFRDPEKFQNKVKAEKLIGALEELISISITATGNRNSFNGLETTGKGGKSFSQVFEDKYVAKAMRNMEDKDIDDLEGFCDEEKTLTNLITKHITSVLDEEKTIFCHGDAHTDNVIEQFSNVTGRKNKYKWIDWEYAQFSIPQMDLVKLLKKSNLDAETEEEIVKHYYNLISFGKGYDNPDTKHYESAFAYEQDYEHFRKVYKKMKILDYLTSAAKYNELAKDSKEHKDKVQDQAYIYFTRALEMINQDETIDEKDRFKLTKALVTASKGKLEQLIGGDLDAIEKELNPLNNQSIVNFGSSILSKYNQPPLSEKVNDWLKKYKRILGVGVFTVLATATMWGVNSELEKRDARRAEMGARTAQHIIMNDSNEKLMPFVAEYAGKYDNISETDLAAVINASFNYDKNIVENLQDANEYPDWPVRDLVRKTKKEIDILQKGLSERQAFVKKEHLENPENNVYSAAKRLHDMKEIFEDIEDVYLAFFTSPEFVKECKKKANNYWDYSKDRQFGHDSKFPYDYQQLTDLAITYRMKHERD